MGDLRAVGTDFLTIGQYLQPSHKHLPLQAYIHPDIFEEYRIQGEGIGFKYVASGPLVRSSYKAGEFFIQRYLKQAKAAIRSAPITSSISHSSLERRFPAQTAR